MKRMKMNLIFQSLWPKRSGCNPELGRLHRSAMLAKWLICCVAAGVAMSSCSDNEPPAPEPPSPGVPTQSETSILLYAVASNNLWYDLQNDVNEMIAGAAQLDLSQSDIWVYSLTPKDDPTLRHLVRGQDGELELEVVKEYSKEQYSTDPARISGVIDDYISLSEASHRGLILWSHASGWTPAFASHEVPQPSVTPDSRGGLHIADASYEDVANHAFGVDQYLGQTDQCDIIELDDAIPASTFDFIWFDCCYMSSIEVIYQLRDKASTIVAYPTEVASEGMPYQLTIPHMAAKDFDLVEAAKAMANYFLDGGQVVTIAVVDTSALPDLAAAAETAVKGTRISTRELQLYSRSPNGPFYDFGQYTRSWGASLGEQWDAARFEQALQNAVIYKAASATGFDRRPINPENFSGLSVHYFDDFEDDASEYYKRLDWFRDVYTTVPEF